MTVLKEMKLNKSPGNYGLRVPGKMSEVKMSEEKILEVKMSEVKVLEI